MDFKDTIKLIAEKVSKIRENIQTEESTRNALISPFIQALGYDMFNPSDIISEYACSTGEKIDYALIKDGKPTILIECRHWKQDLTPRDGQLSHCFHASNAKFGVLTNGIVYKFYTDLETANKMDEKPFLEIDMTKIKDAEIDELKKFQKTDFDGQ
jgi:hypothetical protein